LGGSLKVEEGAQGGGRGREGQQAATYLVFTIKTILL